MANTLSQQIAEQQDKIILYEAVPFDPDSPLCKGGLYTILIDPSMDGKFFKMNDKPVVLLEIDFMFYEVLFEKQKVLISREKCKLFDLTNK